MRLSQRETGLNRARFCLCSPFMGLILGLFLGLALVLSPVAVSQDDGLYADSDQISPSLARVRTLVKANVLDLAERILEEQGPPAVPSREWLGWERQLWSLYRARGKWDALYQRTRQVPPGFPDSIQREADFQAIDAFINLGQGSRARELVRRNLVARELDETERRQLRILTIESYLADDQLNAAGTAMERYQSDYRSQEEDWLILSAEVYIGLENPGQAINLLAPVNQPRSRLLGTYARLLDRSIDPEAAWQRIDGLADTGEVDVSVDPLSVRSVQAFAGRLSSNESLAVTAMEDYVSLATRRGDFRGGIFPVYSAIDLVDTYLTVARREANTAGLLVGADGSWLDYAIGLPPDRLVPKRAIYAHLLTRNRDPASTRRLNDLYVGTLVAAGQTGVIAALFGEGKPFGNLLLGGDAALALSNHALEKGDVALAAAAMGNVDEIPAGMDVSSWTLHVARVLILGGEYERGAQVLETFVRSNNVIGPELADQVLQPVFDLQAVGQHVTALELFDDINTRVKSVRHDREIAYWMAESFQATRQYVQAADYYIYSAMQKDNGFDQWGESARYRAAESLQSANLVADAREMYEILLARSSDDTRRQQLQQKLQELALQESRLQAVGRNSEQ